MPQGPISVSTNDGGSQNTLNIGAAMLVRTGNGRLATIVVIAESNAVGAAYDSASTGAVGEANQIFQIPANAPPGTVFPLNFPVSQGIVIVPGASGVVAVAWS